MDYQIFSLLEGEFGDSPDGVQRLVSALSRALSGPSEATLLIDVAGVTCWSPTALAVVNALARRQRGAVFEERTQPVSGSDLRSVHGISERREGFPIPQDWAGSARMVTVGSPLWNDPKPFADLVRSHTELLADDEDYLATCLREVFQNVDDHARSPVGCVACGRYSVEDRSVSIAAVDLGIGVRASLWLTSRYPEIRTDADALRAVLTREISGRSTSRNLGRGLSTLRAIVTGRGGHVRLVSNGAIATATDSVSEPQLISLPAAFPGTIVYFSFRLAPPG